MIERVVRDWPDLALVAEAASRHRGGRAGYPVLHGARLGEELWPHSDADGV